jgi:competence protein ComEA
MTPWNSTNGSPVSPSPSPSLIARVRASAWTGVAARVAGIVVALLVLGWIGRTAAAGPTSPMSVAATERDASATLLPALVPLDASALPVTSTEPSAPPPVTTPTASPAPASPGAAHGRATATEPVYLNHASVDELRRLPGVGPKRAEAILVLRQRLGRFHRVEDLLRVKGVGRGAVKKWRPLVRLDAPDAGGA